MYKRQEHIFILPNNKNIILAANQAQTLTEDKDIIVVPSKTVPQGITAIINYMPDADAQTNLEAMIEGIGNVKTGQVTYAVRDTHIDDKEIHEGDIMGIDVYKRQIKDRKVRMEDADCPDQICVNHRAISRDGESIICLPNQTIVTIRGGEEPEVDEIAR